MHWRRLRPCPSPCNPAYDIGHCEGRSIDKGRIIGLDSSNLSKPPKLCLATGLAMAHSALVSRRFRKRSITSSSSSNKLCEGRRQLAGLNGWFAVVGEVVGRVRSTDQTSNKQKGQY